MQALIDFDGWRKWKDFSNSTTTTSLEKDKTKTQATKTNKAALQSTGGKETAASRAAVTNGIPSGGAKGRRNLSMHSIPQVLKEELRERSASDETDNTTDSNAEDGGGHVVVVGA